MFEMCASGDERDDDIGERRAGEHAEVLLLFKVRENEPLPIEVEHILRDGASAENAAAALAGLDQKVHLCVMTKRYYVLRALP